MGLVQSSATPPQFGIVFQRGDREMHGIKMQPADTPTEDALALHYVNRLLIAAALPHYLQKRHAGVLIPCAYFKEKSPGMVETGIALFMAPDPRRNQVSTPQHQAMGFDEVLGAGAATMAFDMLGAIAQVSKEMQLPLFAAIGLDLRPRLALGGLIMYFIVEGSNLLVVKDKIDEQDAVWATLVHAGYSALPYTAMVPAEVP